MEKPRRIVLCGSSVIVGTLGASLWRQARYELFSLSPAQQNELEDLVPDVVIFDLEAARPEAAFSLLAKRPELVLLGVSPDNNLVKMWSGKQLRELSTKELVGVIDEQVGNTHVLSDIKEGGA